MKGLVGLAFRVKDGGTSAVNIDEAGDRGNDEDVGEVGAEDEVVN